MGFKLLVTWLLLFQGYSWARNQNHLQRRRPCPFRTGSTTNRSCLDFDKFNFLANFRQHCQQRSCRSGRSEHAPRYFLRKRLVGVCAQLSHHRLCCQQVRRNTSCQVISHVTVLLSSPIRCRRFVCAACRDNTVHVFCSKSGSRWLPAFVLDSLIHKIRVSDVYLMAVTSRGTVYVW